MLYILYEVEFLRCRYVQNKYKIYYTQYREDISDKFLTFYHGSILLSIHSLPTNGNITLPASVHVDSVQYLNGWPFHIHGQMTPTMDITLNQLNK